MIFAVHCIDKPGLNVREVQLAAHKAYLQQHEGKIVFAGPLMDQTGVMCGSLLALETADYASAAALMNDDPFKIGGLYETVRIHEFRNTWKSRL